MPKGKDYKLGTVGKGGSKTPSSVMGSQGSSIKVAPSPSSSTGPTKHTKFPG